jgi:hypothetical protein
VNNGKSWDRNARFSGEKCADDGVKETGNEKFSNFSDKNMKNS